MAKYLKIVDGLLVHLWLLIHLINCIYFGLDSHSLSKLQLDILNVLEICLDYFIMGPHSLIILHKGIHKLLDSNQHGLAIIKNQLHTPIAEPMQ
jgi:hypothetical protein